jgi:UDP-glucuronate decarboxylase
MNLSENEVNLISKQTNLSTFRGEKLLITGGTGMVGSYLVESIVRACQFQDSSFKEIKVLSLRGDFSSIKHLEIFKNITFEVFNKDSPKIFNGFDYVIHAASPASPKYFLSHKNMDEINSGVLDQIVTGDTKRVLFVSSGEVYGINQTEPIQEDDLSEAHFDDTRSSYPLSKLKAEKKCLKLMENFSVEVRIARLFHTFGPGLRENDGRSFADFLWSAARGQKPSLKSSGSDVRTFLYTIDATIGFLKFLTASTNQSIMNIGSSIPFSIYEFANKISQHTGLGNIILPLNELYLNNKPKIIIPNITELRKLGWEQNYDIDKSIDSTMKWIKKKINYES